MGYLMPKQSFKKNNSDNIQPIGGHMGKQSRKHGSLTSKEKSKNFLIPAGMG